VRLFDFPPRALELFLARPLPLEEARRLDPRPLLDRDNARDVARPFDFDARLRDFEELFLRAADFRDLPRFDFFLPADFREGCATAFTRRVALRAVFSAVAATPRPLAAALPASAPMTPPTTAPTGPATLPITAPVAAPAVCFGIGGISMFSEPEDWPLCEPADSPLCCSSSFVIAQNSFRKISLV